MVLTDTLIKSSIQLIPEQSTESLAHTWKVYHSSATPAQFKQLQPFLTAIEKELAKRRKTPLVEEVPDAIGATNSEADS